MEPKKRIISVDSPVIGRFYLWVFLFLMMGMSACRPSENIVYEEFTDVDAAGWNWDAGKSFSFDVTDETHAYNLLTGLRITSEYAYSNIWMLYSLKGPNGYFRKDQFQLVLSDNIGRWKGKGVSTMISYQEPFLNQLPNYNQNLRHRRHQQAKHLNNNYHFEAKYEEILETNHL